MIMGVAAATTTMTMTKSRDTVGKKKRSYFQAGDVM